MWEGDDHLKVLISSQCFRNFELYGKTCLVCYNYVKYNYMIDV